MLTWAAVTTRPSFSSPQAMPTPKPGTLPRSASHSTCSATAMSSAPPLAAGDGADDQQRLAPAQHRLGQREIGRLMGQILLAGEEPDEGPAPSGAVVPQRAAQ